MKDPSSGQVRYDVGGWISGPCLTNPFSECRSCGSEIHQVGELWLATSYADLAGYCPDSANERHEPKGM